MNRKAVEKRLVRHVASFPAAVWSIKLWQVYIARQDSPPAPASTNLIIRKQRPEYACPFRLLISLTDISREIIRYLTGLEISYWPTGPYCRKIIDHPLNSLNWGMMRPPPKIIDANNAFFFLRVASINDYERGQISKIFLCARKLKSLD